MNWAVAALAVLSVSTTFTARGQSLCLPDDIKDLMVVPTCGAGQQVCSSLNFDASSHPSDAQGPGGAVQGEPRVYFIFDQSPGMAGFVRERKGEGEDNGNPGGRGVRIYAQVIDSAEAALASLGTRITLARTEYQVLGTGVDPLNDPSRMTKHCTVQKCPAYQTGGDILHFIENIWSSRDPLKLRSDDLVILITDLQDQVEGVGAGPLAGPLERHVAERSVLIAPFKSRFTGPVYDLPGYQDRIPEKGQDFDGEQPFFLVAIGNLVHLEIYRDYLLEELSKKLSHLPDDIRKRKAPEPLLFTAYRPEVPQSRSLPVAWDAWTKSEESEGVRWGGSKPVRRTNSGTKINLPWYLVRRQRLYTLDGEGAALEAGLLLKADLGSLPVDIPMSYNTHEICWGLKPSSQVVCPSGAVESALESGPMVVSLWYGDSTLPGPWEYFSRWFLGAPEECKHLPWHRYMNSDRLTASAKVAVDQNQASGPTIRLTLDVSIKPFDRSHILLPETPIIATLSVPLHAQLRSKLPTWLNGEQEPWALARTAVSTRIQAVNRRDLYSYGTGGLSELVRVLYDRTQPQFVEAGGATQQDTFVNFPILLFFKID